MGQLISQIKKDGSSSLAEAVKNFIRENGLNEDKVTVSIIDKNSVILRSYFWTINNNRSAEETIYHGESCDIFSWECMTRTSGKLYYDTDLSLDYMYKTQN